MKNFLSKLFSKFPMYWIVVILISVIAGLIFSSVDIGVFTFLGLGICVILFVFFRQVFWYVTGTGDYETKD